MKTCPRCSTTVHEGASFCPSCGGPMSGPPATVTQPYGWAPSPPYTGPQETSGKAIGSLIAGILFFIPFAFVFAIVLGHMALAEIKRSAGRLKGNGMATTGLIFGYGTVLLIPVFLIVAAIAIPNLLRARMATNETSAIATLRTYNLALVQYASKCPGYGYPSTTQDLGPGTGDCNGANLVGTELATPQVVKNGYIFFYGAYSRGSGQGHLNVYTVAADPVMPNTTGSRHYFTDQSGVIRYAIGVTATAKSTPVE
jgi:type IV pilus assembly protein PilA